jgi:hypothetical protein
MTRYFYDCEFHEDGRTIDLLSIGMVAEDGREYYAINCEADWERASAHPWLADNVLPHLPGWWDLDHKVWRPDAVDPRVMRRRQIAEEVAAFISAGSEQRKENELWAHYAAYDHVALCQLWGRMVDLPPAVPMYTNDLQQVARTYGVDLKALAGKQEDEHDALADARWDLQAYRELERHALRMGYIRRRPRPDHM